MFKIILSDDSDAEAESSSAKKAPAKILDVRFTFNILMIYVLDLGR
jgi:hypothetical protein